MMRQSTDEVSATRDVDDVEGGRVRASSDVHASHVLQ